MTRFLWLITLALGAADYDLLIRNARVLDGSGSPWFRADVGVKDGRIRAIGFLGGDATRVIDASDRYLAPGFIDVHSHSDEGLATPDLRDNANMVAQGITLSVVNQDGRSPFPLAGQRERYQRQGVGNNVILMVGHGMLRNRAMQRRARDPAGDGDLNAMRALLEQELKAGGGWGLSAGLEYVPGRFSDTRELIALARAVLPFGGVYISHERSEGEDPMWRNASDPSPPVSLLDAVRETIEIGRASGIPVVCSHLKAKGANYWGASFAAARLIREARDRGVEVYADQYTYDTSGTDGQTVLLPLWALAPPGATTGGQLGQLSEGASFRNAKENLALRLKNPEEARKIHRDIEHEIARRGGAERIIVYEFPEAKYVEKSLAWIAADLKMTPAEAVLWIQRNGLDTRRGGARLRGYSMEEIDIEHIMRQEFTATCTDGGAVRFGAGVPHARFYGAYPRKIRRYVVERETITLPFAIRSMTSLGAQILGLKDRGWIREGYWADLALFDLATIADKATFTKPHQYPEGIPYVFVNGVAVVDNGKLTRATPGRVLTPEADGTRFARK
ncbi:MAG: N-acyl-D-amino-acid deacylase family protein [Bryobacteraceae bacterium]